MQPQKLHFAIHDCHEQGGQDRATLELLKRLHRRAPLELHAYTCNPLPPGLTFHPVPPSPFSFGLARSLWFYLCLYWREFRHKKQHPKDSWFWLSTGLARWQADIFHIQYLHTAWKKERLRLGEPASHGGLLRKFHAWAYEIFNCALEAKTYDNSRRYIVVGSQVAKDLENLWGISSDRIQVVHHGVDSSRFRPASPNEKLAKRAEWNIPENNLVGIFVGSFARKGLGIAIQAMAKLPSDQRSRVHLVVVGEGEKKHFAALAQSLGIAQQIIWLGRRNDVEKVFHGGDFFLFPTAYEPFGLVILEALAAGLPVITSASAGAGDLMVNEKCGYLLPNPVPESKITEIISAWLKNPDQFSDLGRNARRIGENNSWDSAAQKFAASISTLMA